MQSVVTGIEFTLLQPRPRYMIDSTSKDATTVTNLVIMRMGVVVLCPVQHVVQKINMKQSIVLTKMKRFPQTTIVSIVRKQMAFHTKVIPRRHRSVHHINSHRKG